MGLEIYDALLHEIIRGMGGRMMIRGMYGRIIIRPYGYRISGANTLIT
ncbi:MAG: hypothetical protein GX639_17840 [Fibrobacter sp.]|nr:hypothetical protein [Fibrobacter sp.]